MCYQYIFKKMIEERSARMPTEGMEVVAAIQPNAAIAAARTSNPPLSSKTILSPTFPNPRSSGIVIAATLISAGPAHAPARAWRPRTARLSYRPAGTAADLLRPPPPRHLPRQDPASAGRLLRPVRRSGRSPRPLALGRQALRTGGRATLGHDFAARPSCKATRPAGIGRPANLGVVFPRPACWPCSSSIATATAACWSGPRGPPSPARWSAIFTSSTTAWIVSSNAAWVHLLRELAKHGRNARALRAVLHAAADRIVSGRHR